MRPCSAHRIEGLKIRCGITNKTSSYRLSQKYVYIDGQTLETMNREMGRRLFLLQCPPPASPNSNREHSLKSPNSFHLLFANYVPESKRTLRVLSGALQFISWTHCKKFYMDQWYFILTLQGEVDPFLLHRAL